MDTYFDEITQKMTDFTIAILMTVLIVFVSIFIAPFVFALDYYVRNLPYYYHNFNTLEADESPPIFSKTS